MSALPIIEQQRTQSVGLFTRFRERELGLDRRETGTRLHGYHLMHISLVVCYQSTNQALGRVDNIVPLNESIPLTTRKCCRKHGSRPVPASENHVCGHAFARGPVLRMLTCQIHVSPRTPTTEHLPSLGLYLPQLGREPGFVLHNGVVSKYYFKV
ncbi:hypothetical protein RF11_15301 [Thelohanellus kitauei]|uniref:Uncharacterized protein n=1 Tax=Thelohanellus kitauei TaxID=669202 RepID=A0A0C2N5N8_THEKT|nr:hypothetical protein RF11_15301 [Thelohanellus kitauei]